MFNTLKYGMPMKDKVWRVVYIKSNHEKIVLDGLKSMSCNFYVPTVKKPTRKKGKIVFVKRLLLRGYVFVHVEKGKEIEVLKILGVLNFVKVGGEIGIVRDHEIEALSRLCGNASEIEVVNEKDFNKGDKVAISSGQLIGLEGIVEEKGNKQAFYIALEGVGLGLRFLIEKKHLHLKQEVVI